MLFSEFGLWTRSGISSKNRGSTAFTSVRQLSSGGRHALDAGEDPHRWTGNDAFVRSPLASKQKHALESSAPGLVSLRLQVNCAAAVYFSSLRCVRVCDLTCLCAALRVCAAGVMLLLHVWCIGLMLAGRAARRRRALLRRNHVGVVHLARFGLPDFFDFFL